jgi:single-stranded-DNA-specific exonuclease
MAALARWTCDPYSVYAAERLAAELGVSAAVATVLVRRGYATPAAAREFLEAGEGHDPAAFAGIGAACDAILAHVRRGSQIVVHGDYDVDGVCSTAILVVALRSLGAEPGWHIPGREDGYGLSAATVERLAARGVGLIVTVDCAIGAVEEVARARELGVDVVVTDHHRPGERLPDCPIVHPGVSGYPFPELCAAAVAQKLAQALRERAGEGPADDDCADLVGLATVADVVPLRGENRRLVREGLGAIARTARPGLRALMRVAQVDPGGVTEHALGFRLAPRLNAAGRLAHADAALELLMTADDERAMEVARELDALNAERQSTETQILFAAEAARAEQPEAPLYVLAGEGWHAGVIGIVASRMVERHQRPCVMIALDGEAGKGSGRSISAYDLHAGLGACAAHLRRFGGHRAAAGLEIDADRVEPFRRALVEHASGALSPADLMRVERIDAVVGADALGAGLAEELERLGPFGHGNPQPTLLVPAARVGEVRAMGAEGQHARFTIAGGGARASAVAFRTTAGSLPSPDDRVDAAVRLELNEWNGTVEPRLVLRTLCPTEPGECRPLGEHPSWEEAFERELAGAAPAAPTSIGTPSRALRDRRGEGFAGVAGDLLSSGESVAIVCADSARRRPVLDRIVAGVVRAVNGGGEGECPGLVSWAALAEDPALGAGFDHLVALDPPRSPAGERLLASAPGGGFAHLAWGPAEVEFALALAHRDLDLRPAAAAIYRDLRAAGPSAGAALTALLRGDAERPRSPVACARALRVLAEVGLIAFEPSASGHSARVLDAERTDLARSPAYRAAAAELATATAYLAAAPARAA